MLASDSSVVTLDLKSQTVQLVNLFGGNATLRLVCECGRYRHVGAIGQ
jgi:hypothetical protein